MSLAGRIVGVGLIGPGLQGWRESRAVLTGDAPHAATPTTIPTPEALPATERRRAGKTVKLALATGFAACADAGREAGSLAAVFTSSTGDGDNQHAICEVLASDDRDISPTRFHNSVHNAPAGYWGIATGARAPSDSLAAFDASFAAGLVEALGRITTEPSREVVLVSYDAPYPEPLLTARPMPDAFGVGLVLATTGGTGISVTFTREPPTRLDSPTLEALRAAIPSARALPLLQLVARGKPGRVVLEYVGGLGLAIEVAA